MLKTFAVKNQAPAPLIEVMSCTGGCISGPGSNEFPTEALRIMTALLSETET